MSRTYRRKNSRVDFKNWHYSRYFSSRGYNWWDFRDFECPEELSTNYKKYVKAYYHKDTNHYGWNGNAPASFRRSLNRLRRGRDSNEIKRINAHGNYEEYSFDPWKKDAGWLYW